MSRGRLQEEDFLEGDRRTQRVSGHLRWEPSSPTHPRLRGGELLVGKSLDDAVSLQRIAVEHCKKACVHFGRIRRRALWHTLYHESRWSHDDALQAGL